VLLKLFGLMAIFFSNLSYQGGIGGILSRFASVIIHYFAPLDEKQRFDSLLPG